MAVIGILVTFAAFALLIGAVLGWVATFRANRIGETVARLDRRLQSLEKRLGELEREAPEAARPEAPAPRATPSPQTLRPEPAAPAAEAPPPAPQPPPPPRPEAEPATAATPKPQPARDFLDAAVVSMRRNWMAWLGGVSVSLAGIFLVGYSIEQGYLGPVARIVAAILAGVALHAAAEYFRRRSGQAHAAFAAMAGGGSITLYAAFYAALELYSLLAPGLTFALLAVVSLITMALATVHGPLLAVIGIFGAYTVPLFVSGHGGGSLVELIYSLIVTSAALLLIRFVYRPWLWYGTLAGALGWWLISLSSSEADGYRGLYLAAFAYLALALPVLDWLLKRKPAAGDPATERVQMLGPFSTQAIDFTVALTALAQAISIVNLGFTGLGAALVLWSPLIVIVLWATRARETLKLAPWFLLVTELGAWLLTAVDDRFTGLVFTGLAESDQPGFLGFAVLMAILFSVGTAVAQRGRAFSHLHVSLSALAPVLWLALAYLLVTDLSTDWRWGVATLALGLGYITLATQRLSRTPGDGASIWLLLAGHVAYSLAVAMFLREATLTFALAAQLISLAWLRRGFELKALEWITKGVLAVVVARLTLNPWLLTYLAYVHWSLWTYGGSTACALAATMLTTSSIALRKWLEAATLHLLVMFLGAEVRYMLYDGAIFVRDFTLTEAAIDSVLFGGLALSYYQRSLHGAFLSRFYTLCSRVIAVLALMAYAASLTLLNPLWSSEPVAATPIRNILLLAYGAPIAVAVLAWFVYEARFRRVAAAIAGLGLFVFVSLEIRHLWHGALDLGLGTLNAEVYTYSAAWLVMAVVTMLGSTALGARDGYRAGIGLLFIVIGKIFLIDMSDLEGLLRVASFMGLGLALLGLAWLYQRTARRAAG